MYIKRPNIHIFQNVDKLAAGLAAQFRRLINQAAKKNSQFNVALSGGSTPAFFFQKLAASPFRETIAWQNIHFFWGDERCVPPDHPDSNYGMTKTCLFDPVAIPAEIIHRIVGEADPEREAQRYAREIRKIVPDTDSGLPQFDWILLGLGADGHTASLFPGPDLRIDEKKICIVTRHPETGQMRISLTLPLINNAKRVSFIVSGASKAAIVAQIVAADSINDMPASLVKPVHGKLEWFLDQAAAAAIDTESIINVIKR